MIDDPDDIDADLRAIAHLPAIKIMNRNHVLREASHSPNAALLLPAVLHTMGRDEIASPAILAWALSIAELGPPRLPGGALADGIQTKTVAHGRDAARETLWFAEFENCVNAARDRDGVELFASVTRGMRAGPQNFAASFAVSALHAYDAFSVRPQVIALLTLLACSASSAERWSVCGPAYRLTHAFMTAPDLGPLAFEAIAPEYETIVKTMGPRDQVLALSVVARTASQIMGGHPDEPLDFDVVAAPHGLPASEAGDTQHQATRGAIELITAYRERDPERPGQVVSRFSTHQRALAMWGAANLLGNRVAALWGR